VGVEARQAEPRNYAQDAIDALSGRAPRPDRKLLQMSATEAVDTVRFDERGLVPCVVQDWATGEVLTLAYMDAEALQRTLATREIHFHSRSRGQLWHKGETSGNVQRVRQLRYDCDADALVALVEPAGPACHTGQRSCFYRDLEGTADTGVNGAPADGEPVPAAYEASSALERTLADRRDRRPDGSYTVELLDDPERIGAKVREEADEVATAAADESDERVAEEAADVLYHLHVLLLSRGVPMSAVLEALNGRRR
jgi:phosphoribosyl-ATP pyrophosphohydrolase/phosphoribosyl-AMP cyclohydrolase